MIGSKICPARGKVGIWGQGKQWGKQGKRGEKEKEIRE